MKKMIKAILLGSLAWVSYHSSLDHKISSSMKRIHHPLLTVMMKTFSTIGSVLFLLPCNLLLVFCSEDRKHARRTGLHTLLAWGLSNLLKTFFGRNRPSYAPLAFEKTNSFPSSHAMANQTFYDLFSRPSLRWSDRFFCQLMVVNIALSRIYLGVHYPSDVLGGMAFGTLYTEVVDRFHRFRDTEKKLH